MPVTGGEVAGMEYRILGRTGLRVSAIGFGAGPVAALMTDPEAEERQQEVIAHALEVGINWFDTAPGYGDGASERSLGAALRAGRPRSQGRHVATKVRLQPDELHDIPGAVRRSLEQSLRRLQLDRVDLLQLHNAITSQPGGIRLSLTPQVALQAGEALAGLREEGLVGHIGMTAQGEASALREVVCAGVFATAQVPWNLLEAVRTAGFPARHRCGLESPRSISEAGVAVIAIRVRAGGALALQPPSEHTKRTRYFPLAQYEADLRLAEWLQRRLPRRLALPEAALRYVTHAPDVDMSVVGFGDVWQIDEAVSALLDPLPDDILADLTRP